MSAGSRGAAGEDENSVPRRDNEGDEGPTINDLIERLGEGILLLGGNDKENVVLQLCLGILENLEDVVMTTVGKLVKEKVESTLARKIDHLKKICKDIQTTTTTEKPTAKPKPSYAAVAAARVPPPRPFLRTRISN